MQCKRYRGRDRGRDRGQAPANEEQTQTEGLSVTQRENKIHA